MSDSDRLPSQEQVWEILCELQQRISKIEQSLAGVAPPVKQPATPPLPPPAAMPAGQVKASPPESPAEPAQPAAVAPTPPPLPEDIWPRFKPSDSTAKPPTQQPPPMADRAIPADRDSGLARAAAAAKAKFATDRDFNLEEMIGTKWLLVAGVVVLLIASVFFYKYAYEQGWVNPALRVLFQAAIGVMILIGAEVALRKNMRLFSAGLFGLGIVWLYQAVFVASPNGTYGLISTPTAFALMCAVTAVGAGLSLRSRFQLAAIISLLGAFAAPVMLSTGENRQVFLMSYMLVVNAGFLILALAMRWRAIGPLAVGCTTVLFGLWYAEHYDPGAYGQTLVFGWALTAVLSAYGVAAVRLRRIQEQLGGAVILLSVAVMAVLVAVTSEDGSYLHPFAVQTLVLAAAAMALGLWRKWHPLVPIAAASATVILGAWMATNHEPSMTFSICAYGWCLFALVLGAVLAAGKAAPREAYVSAIVVVGAAMLVGWVAMREHLALAVHGSQLMALIAIMLALCAFRRWDRPRIAAWAWAAGGLVALWDVNWAAHGELTRAAWIWAAFALLTLDVQLRAWVKRLASSENLNAILATVATGLMYGGTYALLHDSYASWMGTYTAAVGAAAIAAAWLVRRWADKRRLAYAYLGQGLILITLAVPIQFNFAAVTVAWSIQGVVTMFLARRLRSRTLLAKAFIVLFAALIHYVAVELPGDEALSGVLLTIGDVELGYALALAAGLAAGFLAAAAILRGGKTIFVEDMEIRLAWILVAVASVFWGVMACMELPAIAASFGWLVLAAGLAAVAIWRWSGWLLYWSAALLAVSGGKWFFYDTLYRRIADGADTTIPVLANPQCIVGIALAAALLLFARFVRTRRLHCEDALAECKRICAGFILLAAVLVFWNGNFEIDRYFSAEPVAVGWADPAMAGQMTYTLWWGVFAAAVLTIGFAAPCVPLRWLALVLLAATVGKVLVKDMSGVEYIYRVLAFAAVGVILLAGSLLYHRFFRITPDEQEQ